VTLGNRPRLSFPLRLSQHPCYGLPYPSCLAIFVGFCLLPLSALRFLTCILPSPPRFTLRSGLVLAHRLLCANGLPSPDYACILQPRRPSLRLVTGLSRVSSLLVLHAVCSGSLEAAEAVTLIGLKAARDCTGRRRWPPGPAPAAVLIGVGPLLWHWPGRLAWEPSPGSGRPGAAPAGHAAGTDAGAARRGAARGAAPAAVR